MIQRLQAKRNSEKGFTLIELLIVIIVLGILAAIVVFAVSGTKKDATEATCKTDAKSIELSAESVLAKVGTKTQLSDVLNTELNQPASGGLLKSAVPMVKDGYTLNWVSGVVTVAPPTGSSATFNSCDGIGS